MSCVDCPYIKDEYKNDKINGYLGMIDEDIIKSCYCEKIDDVIVSSCEEDAIDNCDIKNKNITNKKGIGKKRERDKKYKEHLKRINEINDGFIPPVIKKDYIYNRQTGQYMEVNKPYYKRIYRKKTSSYYKKQSNKAIRKYRGMISKNGGYKRIYDFWCELW